jgi:hypothetical protein
VTLLRTLGVLPDETGGRATSSEERPPSGGASKRDEPDGSAAPEVTEEPAEPDEPEVSEQSLLDVLATLPKWVRDLIVHGAASRKDRYFDEKRGKVDRSLADMAVVGALVREDWGDADILFTFQHRAWGIGAKYREMESLAGPARAVDYLKRTIRRARANHAAMQARQ